MVEHCTILSTCSLHVYFRGSGRELEEPFFHSNRMSLTEIKLIKLFNC